MNPKCSICTASTVEYAQAIIRNKYEARFLRCTLCDFIFIENPTWLAESYAEPIDQSDTGYVWRNLWARDKLVYIVESLLDPNGTFLDYAAGYGLFVRMMRDLGYDFRWSDLYCQNLFARGFEASFPLTGPFEAVTAFEVFEHLTSPREELKKLSTITSCLIFSTKIVPDPAPQPSDWWYYGLLHGQHVAFYTRKSLEMLAFQFDYQLTTDGEGLHIFSRKEIPATIFSPTMSRWQKLWKRPKRTHNRQSLTMHDHNFIVDKLRRENQSEQNAK
jgi:2-polyprenyl-3-methyl-5-hydroxy-6-metoxy-1,4-benzoquinol methylase